MQTYFEHRLKRNCYIRSLYFHSNSYILRCVETECHTGILKTFTAPKERDKPVKRLVLRPIESLPSSNSLSVKQWKQK